MVASWESASPLIFGLTGLGGVRIPLLIGAGRESGPVAETSLG
jgi:hypothetical protein